MLESEILKRETRKSIVKIIPWKRLEFNDLAVGRPLELLLKHADGTTERLSLIILYDEIAWLKAGSFLGYF